MQSDNLFLIFCSKLNELKLTYMVSGSVAAMLYGEPRLTNDIDIVVILPRENIASFTTMFSLDDFYCPPTEVIILESKRSHGGHFNLIHHDTGFKADIYIANPSLFYKWAFEHTKVIALGDDSIRVAPPEYVIVSKLSFYKEGGSKKHILDIEAMVNTASTLIDWRIVEVEASARGIEEELRLIEYAKNSQ